MKLLVCYEMAHNKGRSVGDSIISGINRDYLTPGVIAYVRGEVQEAVAKKMRAEGFVPTGTLIFRSILKLDEVGE